MQIDIREVSCGGIFVVIAALFAYGTVDLPMGTAIRMGPGYFPLMLAAILGALGVMIIVKGLGRATSPIGGIPWRGVFFILLGPILFGLTVRGLGVAPAITLVAFIAALASSTVGWRTIVLLPIGLTVFCIVVFSYGLGLPYAMFGPWVAPLLPGV